MVTVVVGGQYGSEGKGAIAAALHQTQKYGWAVRVGGPNAGHTVYDSEGYAFALRQIPVAAAVDPGCMLVVAGGSEIDLEVLEGEIRLLEEHGHEVGHRLLVDTEATVISTEDHDRESGGLEAGSTRKGIGSARASRCMRESELVRDMPVNLEIGRELFLGETACDTQRLLQDARKSVLIEGTQGYGLGSHAGGYPHCTSGDCRAIDFLAQAGVPPSADIETWVVLRTYPIRIAGNSGPMLKEVSWQDVGVPPEFTTVTKKERRVGEWDLELAQDAIRANGGNRVKVAITFADYWHPELAGAVSAELLADHHIYRFQELQRDLGAPICMIGTGGSTHIHLPSGF